MCVFASYLHPTLKLQMRADRGRDCWIFYHLPFFREGHTIVLQGRLLRKPVNEPPSSDLGVLCGAS